MLAAKRENKVDFKKSQFRSAITKSCMRMCFIRYNISRLQSIGSTTKEGICERECPQSCHEQGYVARITTSLWPRASYYDRIKDSWKNQIPSMETMREAREARTNLAKLEVYYEVNSHLRSVKISLCGGYRDGASAFCRSMC